MEGVGRKKLEARRLRCSHWASRAGPSSDKGSLWLVSGFSCHSSLLCLGSSSAGDTGEWRREHRAYETN